MLEDAEDVLYRADMEESARQDAQREALRAKRAQEKAERQNQQLCTELQETGATLQAIPGTKQRAAGEWMWVWECLRAAAIGYARDARGAL